MKLKTQGLIVIFTPLAFQLLLVAMFLVLIGNANAEFERNFKSEHIVNECNLIVGRILEGMEAFLFANFGPQYDVATAPLDEARENFEAEVQKLHVSIKDDPAQRNGDRLLVAQGQKMAELAHHNDGHHRAERTEISRKLLTVLSMIARTESQKIDIADSEKNKQRNQSKLILLSFAIAGIIISIAIALVCAMRLRRVLGHITENTDRFSRREPLLDPLPGSDEAANLDQVIHAMDQSIEVALHRARALVDNAADLVCSIDRDGYFEKANSFAARMLGKKPSQLIGTPVIDLVVADDVAMADEQINKSFETNAGYQFELRLQTLEQKIVETSWSTFWSQQDRSLFCVVGDITERKNIERLKQDFIGMISHDLRSPLMSIGSSIALVQSGAMGPVSPAVMKDLDGAEKTVDRLIAMINDLLDFEKLEAGKMQFNLAPVSVDEVAQEAFRDVETLARGKNISLDAKPTGLMVLGDREKIIQLLINLLGNAIRYSPEGGPVSIRAVNRASRIEVAVCDRGPGVPAEFQKRVFAPFENAPGSKQTKEGGTGLGLAICKLIIQGHDGDIGVRNRDGGGSEFWFTLDSSN